MDSHVSWKICEYLFQAWFPCLFSLNSLKPLVLCCLISSIMTLSSLCLWKLTFLCCPEGSWMRWALLWLVISTTSLLKTCWMLCAPSAWWTISPWLPLTSFSRRTSLMSCWCQVRVSVPSGDWTAAGLQAACDSERGLSRLELECAEQMLLRKGPAVVKSEVM